tara:strand:+ start:12538 stop:12909 length:372 start_codon:yes stop_codon:yes gene_type:complete
MLEAILNSLPTDVRAKAAGHLRERVFNDLNSVRGNAKAIAMDNNSAEYRHMDGLGQMTASIDSKSYHYWNAREPGCWNDKKFVREYLRDNPEARVNTRSGKIQVGYDGDGFIRHRVGRKVKVY